MILRQSKGMGGDGSGHPRSIRLFICFLLPWLWLTDLVLADEFGGVQDSDFVIVGWQVQDGLPSARLLEVLQTRDGYLWLATLEGLARFDGVRFERFYDSDTPGLASSMIKCLLEDSHGRLWYGTQSGEIGWKDVDGFHTLNRDESTGKSRRLGYMCEGRRQFVDIG